MPAAKATYGTLRQVFPFIAKWKPRRQVIIVSYHAISDRLTIHDLGGYESRNESTLHLFLTAMRTARVDIKRDFTIEIMTGDADAEYEERPHFAYSAAADQKHTIRIPDFLFWGWPEVGIPDYEAMADSIVQASRQPPSDPRLFWIGGVKAHWSREKLATLAENDKRMHIISMNWQMNSYDKHTRRLQADQNQFLSLPDHCRYKYLIDIQGRGYSARMKLLLFSGRALFLQQRAWKEYFYRDLQPFTHYIPVREDLDDLGEKLDWAETHPEEVRIIAQAAQAFAQTHLRRPNAIEEFRARIVDYANTAR